MRRMLLALAGIGVLSAVWAASYQPPGTAPDDFVAYRAPLLALTGATVVDGTGAPPQHGMTLLIRDGRIAALGPDGQVPVPDGAQRLDLAGKSVLPGYVMLHEHFFYP